MTGNPILGRSAFSAGMLWVALIAAFMTLLAPGVATAQANQIAIIVNDSVITTYDIQRRRSLLRLQRTKGDLNEKAREQLVEEAIKMAEVKRLRATVSDARVNQSFNRFARSNKMSPKQMTQILSQAGIGADHFKEFIRVQMSWPRVVQARYGSRDGMSTQGPRRQDARAWRRKAVNHGVHSAADRLRRTPIQAQCDPQQPQAGGRLDAQPVP